MPVTRKLFTDVMGGRSASEYIGRTGELFYDDATGELRRSNGTLPGGVSVLTPTNIDRAQGCFHKTATVTADQANTAYSFDWYTDTTVHLADDVSITSAQPTRVVLSKAGNYLAFIEMMVKITGNANRDVFLWLSKNGTNISQTTVKVALRGGSVENPLYETLAKQWFVDGIQANDYIEVKFALSRVDLIELEYTPAQTTPYIRPAIPSAVLTITTV